MLTGKTVVMGVCGGIAAYKAVDIASRLVKLNASVHVIMTASAAKFVTPLTFQTISRNIVVTDMFREPVSWEIQHISLAEKADLILVAPATANIIGKAASGIADDMLATTLMATRSPVLFVPAMNPHMYENPILQENRKKLSALGYFFMEPDSGTVACGAEGKGRLPSPEAIVERVKELLLPVCDMRGKRVLLTAGPTQEAIDPVRYISNHSSGKMGYAIAEAAARRGAEVCIISGPVHIPEPFGVQICRVTSAEEMYKSVIESYEAYNIMIMVAAVADYRCAAVAENKIKKSEDQLSLALIKNPDIAEALGRVKGDRILTGFSAETEAIVSNAKAKITAKNLDLIVANDVTVEGAGFGADTNIVKIINKEGVIRELPIMSKQKVANVILDEIMKLCRNKS